MGQAWQEFWVFNIDNMKRAAPGVNYHPGEARFILSDCLRKGHHQQVLEVQLFRLRVRTHTNFYLFLIDGFQKGPQDPVPEGKYGAIIGIPLFDFHGMMNAMHGWGDKKDPPDRLEPLRNDNTTVMKLGAQDDGAFKNDHAHGTGSQEKNEGDFDDSGNGQFTEMKSGCR